MKQPAITIYICVSICFVWIPSIEKISGQSTLTATPLEPIVDSSVTLSCNYSGTNILGSSTWFKNNAQIGKLIHTDNGCFEGTPLELDNYTALCISNEYFTLTLVSVTLDLHNTSWRCEQAAHKSNWVVLAIEVLVKSLSFDTPDSSILTLRENISKRISCSTSFSRPRGNITWYITERTELSKVFLQESDSSYNTSTDLVSTRSTLHVNLNRTFNQWVLVCEAENIRGYKAVSKNISLNITYPTNKPNIVCLNNGIYKVIQNTKGNLTCAVDGGNPAGTLHWNCTGGVTEYQGPHNSITQTVVWNATQSQYCTCTSTNIAGTSPTSVKTQVLYRPVIHQMQNMIVIMGASVTLHCDVKLANPPVYSIRWTSNKHNVSEATLTITNVSRSDDMVYTCTANNTMDPSCQDIVRGSTSTSLHVEVLYPPFVNITQGKTFIVKEGDSFNYTCPVVPGNPASTNITWRRSNGTKTWSSAQLLILNVTKYDDSVYTCYASNWMVTPTGTTANGNVSVDIRLNVQFKTNVTDFYIRGYANNISVVAMETIQLIFTCRLQSNPTAEVRIFETEIVVNKSNANELLYYTKASCSDGPVYYSCYGNNSLNNKPSTRQIQLLVRCTPRADMNSNVQFIVSSAINQTVTLSYTALAYPYPSFVWYRYGSSIHTRGSRINIFSTDLQTYLIINHVGEKDFGEYTLTITNDLGSINELFHIKHQEPTAKSCHCTSQNVSAIIGGTFGGLVVLCGIVISVFIYRRRYFHSPMNNEQPECSSVQSSVPVTYENLKMDQIPNESVEFQRETASSRTSETNLDHPYEGLSRENNGKETEYTCLGDNSKGGE